MLEGKAQEGAQFPLGSDLIGKFRQTGSAISPLPPDRPSSPHRGIWGTEVWRGERIRMAFAAAWKKNSLRFQTVYTSPAEHRPSFIAQSRTKNWSTEVKRSS